MAPICHCALLQTHALENGIFAEFLLDGQRRLLQLLFARQRRLLRLAPGVLGGKIGEQVQLLHLLRLRLVLRDDVRGDEIHAPDEQPTVHDAVKQGGGRFHGPHRGAASGR